MQSVDQGKYFCRPLFHPCTLLGFSGLPRANFRERRGCRWGEDPLSKQKSLLRFLLMGPFVHNTELIAVEADHR